MVVELLINGSDENFDIRVSLLNSFNAFRRCDQVHQLDVFYAAALEAINGSDCRAAGCQHRVEQQYVTILDVVRQLAVIFDRLHRVRIAVHAHVTDLGSRDHFEHAFYHAKTGAQDGNQRDLLAGNHMHTCICQRGFDGDFLERQVAGCLIAHQHGDFAGRFAELLYASGFIAHQAELMLDQRVIHFMNGSHNRLSPLM